MKKINLYNIYMVVNELINTLYYKNKEYNILELSIKTAQYVKPYVCSLYCYYKYYKLIRKII